MDHPHDNTRNSTAVDVKEYFRSAAIRVVLYGVAIILSVLVIYKDASYAVDGVKFGELSYTEFLQELMLLTTAGLFFVTGLKRKEVRGFAVLMAGIALTAFVREFDWLLDKIVHGFWKYPASLVLGGAAIWAWKLRAQFLAATVDFLKRPSWGVLLSGFLCVFVFSRLFGKGSFWQTLMEDDYIRWAKNAAEEGTELFGYTLLTIAAVEYMVAKLRE
jgi:hypothetical protein